LNKKELRVLALEKRRLISRADYWILNDQILTGIKLIDWSVFQYVHVFLPIKENNEVDTFEILTYFKTNYPNLKIVIPKAHFSNLSMTNILFDDENTILIKNKYQIPEPLYGEIVPANLIDAVIVPLLSFDIFGHRIGYGAGFYDRFLRNCRADILKIGLSFFPPENEIVDTHEFDIKLTHCITPKKTYTF
jgi:5-formyltetrahydrofolate cyclo-ligase